MIFCPFCNAETETKHCGDDQPVLRERKVTDAGRRAHGRCRTCNSVERERLMHWCFTDRMRARTAHRDLLHFAPDRVLSPWLRSLDRYAITLADLGGAFDHLPDLVTCDISRMAFEDRSFDVLIASHVLEHVPDDRRAFSEILRVLRPGGIAFLLVPIAMDGRGPVEEAPGDDPARRAERFGQYDHVRIYDMPTFVARCEDSGLDCEVFDPAQRDPDRARAWGLFPGGVVFVAHKP